PPRPNATAGRVARRQLRGVGVVVGLVCALVAAAVFVVTPRSGESAISLTPASGAAPAQAGFSNVVRLGVGPIGTGSREPMLNVKIESGGQALGWEDDPWLVRGAALDQYNPENDTWFRSQFAIGSDQDIPIDRLNARSPRPDDRRTIYTAEVSLRDARQRHIFSVVPVPTKIGASGFDLVRFESEALGSVAFSPIDQQLRATASVVGAATYRLSWPISSPRVDRGDGSLGSPPSLVDLPPGLLPSATRREPLYHYGPGSDLVEDVTVIDAQTYARRWTVEAERVRGLARRVLAQAGIERDPDARHTPEDLRVASVLGEYLRRGYRYDLANPPVRGGRDPVIEFLFETRRGHCELFAAGLIALCRSVGVPARMVTGFRASEFNTLGGYYVVRQSNAHAWVEVDGGPGVGWYTFDATPPERVEAQHRAPDGLFASLREFYEHLEFAWIRTVVAFDGRTQEAVLDNVAASVGASRARGEALAGRFVAWVRSLPRVAHLNRGEALVLVLCSVGLLIAAGLLVRIAWVRRRRLVRLQLTSLPPERRRGLSRRLGFYLAMLDLLERRGYRRPAWQSPSAFAHELAEANPLRFDPVVALTELFYEVRFGHRELDDDRKRRAKVHLKRLEQSVAGPVD
ncbi:MAG: transglutaminaseTgpA domain-containing protein, partial [Planctomycetota bacterium]